MSSVTKLKDEARRHEQQEEWDRAIQLYLRVLRGAEEGETEVELPLYNRVGDLYLRLGQPPDAVTYYEQAAERYADAGLFNNAIALCNKALRYAPGRLPLIRKLGRFCALQGFVTDARRWFLTYAERMFAQGAADDALAALEDFANISDDPEIRELLARHLLNHGRAEQATTEFRRAYGMRMAAGDTFGADQLKAQVLELLPDAGELTPLPLATGIQDLGAAEEGTAEPLPALEPRAAQESEWATDEETETSPPLPMLEEPAVAAAEQAGGPRAQTAGVVVQGLESHASAPVEPAATGSLEGLVSTAMDAADVGRTPTLPGLETTSLQGIEPPAAARDDAEAGAPLAGFDAGALYTPGQEQEDEEDTSDLTPLPLLDAPAAAERHAGDDLFNVGVLQVRPDFDGGAPATAAAAPANDYIDLLSFIDPEEDRIKDTRFVVEEKEPTGDEDRDFAELLSQFKAKLKEAVDPEDAASHYDLGLAFKEMGLVDEAIAEFQRAMRAGEQRLKVLEELGQCFITKGQNNIAVRMLQTAIGLQTGDDLELIGVYYHLGRAFEALGKVSDARDAYERVIGIDINFMDVSERIVRL
jgi:tetratricopeptide (TPR) repeat protein